MGLTPLSSSAVEERGTGVLVRSGVVHVLLLVVAAAPFRAAEGAAAAEGPSPEGPFLWQMPPPQVVGIGGYLETIKVGVEFKALPNSESES